MNERQKQWLYRLLMVLIFSLCLFMFLQIKTLWLPFYVMLKAILIPFLIAVFITYLLHPVVEKLHDSGLPRSLSILIIYLLFFGGIGLAFYKGIPIFLKQAKDLSENIPMVTASYQSWIDGIHDQTTKLPDDVHKRIEKLIHNAEKEIGNLLESLLTSFRVFFDYIVIFAVIPFLVFYMLKDIEELKKAIWYITPKKWRQEGKKFLHDVNESLGNYIRGQLFVCLLIALFATFALWVFHIKYPLILGLIIGVTNVIPYFGPIIGAIPAVLIAATISIQKVIIVMIIVFILQFLEGNILSPLIVGKSLHMHPIVIILALLAGGEMAGVLGLILAVPIVVILKVTLLHIAHFSRVH
ncbi:AI-2E family transporter [Aeribacillus alveayuensis]|uniref:PurR-regulated permease PerM n=1 Tax=Aeribacillus alveayuensis TaxID=279215 RepID=A0ABT9VJV0_9BACI|nr:putative PurR-regulated permease PerM [Bacillus alveayuensis]